MRSAAAGLVIGLTLATMPGAGYAAATLADSTVLAKGNSATSADVPSIARGGVFVVDCGCLGSAHDVRVVLSLLGGQDDVSPGYSKVLATTEHVEKHAIRVGVPDVPHLAQHTVDVKVYVVGKGTPAHACDAGQFRIT